MEYTRKCPDCGKKLTYSCERYLKRATDNNSVCNKCKKMPEGWLENIRRSQMGKKGPYKTDKTAPKLFFRNCPECGEKIGHKQERLKIARTSIKMIHHSIE